MKEYTVEEIVEMEKTFIPIKQTYGKYGTLAKEYIEKHDSGKLMLLAGELPQYLHGIDKQAEDMYNVMYEKLSKKDEFKMTDDYISNLKKRRTMEQIIEEIILNDIVYV